MIDPDNTDVPEDPTEALRLAAACIAHAAGFAVMDSATLPDEWYARYGAVQEILNNTGELGHNAIDAVQRMIVGRGLYVDELGEAAEVEAVLGEWIVHTNATVFALEQAAGHWSVAHNRIGRLGVRDQEDGD